MKWATAGLAVLLVGTARAQLADMRQVREISGRWAEYYAAVYRVPIELVEAIIDEESGWNPYAVSNKGAAGIMQLMPGTAVRFGVHNRFRVDENIHGGVAYLAWLKQRFNGDLRLMTAAYYVGEDPIFLRGLDYSSADVQGRREKNSWCFYGAVSEQLCGWPTSEGQVRLDAPVCASCGAEFKVRLSCFAGSQVSLNKSQTSIRHVQREEESSRAWSA